MGGIQQVICIIFRKEKNIYERRDITMKYTQIFPETEKYNNTWFLLMKEMYIDCKKYKVQDLL